MSDFWRRSALEAELVRGSTSEGNGTFFGEVHPGRVVDAAVFECDPCSDGTRAVRLVVEARVDVVLRVRRVLQPSLEVQDLRWRGLIALSAAGGHPDQRYFWVQIFSDDAERIRSFDGRTWDEDVARDYEAGPPGAGFDWLGRLWFVDTLQDERESARYRVAVETFGSPNCDTMYDAPTSQLALESVMGNRREIARVEKTTRFYSFLYALPLDPIEARAAYLPRQSPQAVVAWSRDQALERSTPEADGELTLERYRVHFVMPNGIAPSTMTSVLWRRFHGR